MHLHHLEIGGTLLDRMKKERILSEDVAREYIKSILSAVKYIHSQNIVHRDLKVSLSSVRLTCPWQSTVNHYMISEKAENVVFTDETPDGVLKVIDFGDAKKIKEHDVYTDFACTLHYV